jgi:hypothetical protein
MTYRGTVHLIVGSLVLGAVVYGQVRVRVVGEDGAGLAGVRVFSETDYGRSDEGGYFNLDTRARVIRFSKDGYRPLTKFFSDVQSANQVRLTRDAQGLWKPPLCSPIKNNSTVSGRHMQFLVPSGARVQKAKDTDYSTNSVCRGRECVEHGWGPLWGGGMPPFPEEFLAGWREMTERDVYDYDDPDVPGVEYRGIRRDGTFVRFVGIIGVTGETIAYDRATAESARLFDRLIDSFCWIEKRP